LAQHPDYFKEKGHRKQFCDELFSALSYLHDKKILHLDLKPSNILITNKGHHVKLIDLGFGWSESFLHDLGFTRDYCAPEQQAAKTELFGPATDIYALGKILQHYGLAKDAVAQRCLKENPKERYQSIDALRKAMQRSEMIGIVSRIGIGLVAALLIGAIVWLVGFREKPLPPRPPAPEGAIKGLFTINEAGDQVYFAKGNLQYQATTNLWRLADHQRDAIGQANDSISQTNEREKEYDRNILATYNVSLGKHDISAMAGWQYLTYHYDYLYGYRDGNIFPQFKEINAFDVTNQKTSGTASEWALMSYFGRFNYAYASKYLFEANVRYDGSSRFAAGYRWGVFPSFSVGWRFSEESFMDWADSWLNNGKLRVSYGHLGNQQGVGAYATALNVNTTSYAVFGGDPVSAA